jgi:hypothetical protein
MSRNALRAAAAALAVLTPAATALAQGAAQPKPYQVEWVYRVRYGGQEEWWRLFQKYQIATLDREKQLGYVTSYSIVRPGLHTSEDSRWDYRIVITYADQASASHGGEVERALFPDKATRTRDEERRWELTANHWDLPIHEIDPHAEAE